MQIFYIDLTDSQIFPWKILNMFARIPIFEKSFYTDKNHTSFGEKPIFFLEKLSYQNEYGMPNVNSVVIIALQMLELS